MVMSVSVLVARAETPATLGVCRVSGTSLAALARASAPYAERAPDLGHERHMSPTALLVKAAS